MSKLSFVRARGQDLTKDSHIMAISNISSKVTKPIVATSNIEPSEDEETIICSNRPGHMTNMATTVI